MNCTQCSCEQLTEISFSDVMDICILEGHCVPNKYMHIFICEQCGHLEFFIPSLGEKMAEKRKQKEALDEEIEQLSAKKEELIKNLLEPKKIELVLIEEKLKDLDITVREQKELKEKAVETKKRIEGITDAITSLSAKILSCENEKREIYKKEKKGFIPLG